MIGDLHEALADLEEKETDERTRRRIPNLPVQASHIWRGFPFALQPGDNVSPLRRLMTLWVNPEAQWASHPTADVATARDTIRQWRERNEQLQAELGRLYRDNQQLSIDNEDLTAENSRLRADQAEADATQQDLEQIIEALQQSITQLRDELAKERNNGYEQEHHVRQYRSDKNHLKRRLAEAAAEREDAEDRARGALKDYEDLSHEFREFRRRHGEGCRGQDRGRRPSRRNMSPGLGGPPSTFETRGYADNRRRQSSSRRPNVTSSGWNAGNGQNHAPDSPPAPPIPYRSRPFRAELDADE
ncbi:hypothetical protein EJ04DRAFT_134484 [Polyplosphaeria fusca]|uniref:Uncharacterized protein n=1 Tax=Polyplosphaeria fusca TaxID=682080 RepID=A0A9P4R2N7_9PLEO|nr:hypothetical protein EJ04DRAFT_134484 [Polyplosphaeria fusca]